MEKNLKLIYWGTFITTFVGVLILYGIFGPSTMKKADLMSYLEQISPIVQQTSTTVASMGRDPASAGLSSAKDMFQSFHKQVAAINPPASLSGVHQELVESMGNYAKGFELYEAAMKGNNEAKMKEANDLISKGAGQLYEVSQKILKTATY